MSAKRIISPRDRKKRQEAGAIGDMKNAYQIQAQVHQEKLLKLMGNPCSIRIQEFLMPLTIEQLEVLLHETNDMTWAPVHITLKQKKQKLFDKEFPEATIDNKTLQDLENMLLSFPEGRRSAVLYVLQKRQQEEFNKKYPPSVLNAMSLEELQSILPNINGPGRTTIYNHIQAKLLVL